MKQPGKGSLFLSLKENFPNSGNLCPVFYRPFIRFNIHNKTISVTLKRAKLLLSFTCFIQLVL